MTLDDTKRLDEMMMITQFKDLQLSNCPMKFSFIDQKAADAGSAADGQETRVPSLSPKMKVEEWKSVDRVPVKGFQDHKYFPSSLCPAFTMALSHCCCTWVSKTRSSECRGSWKFPAVPIMLYFIFLYIVDLHLEKPCCFSCLQFMFVWMYRQHSLLYF